VLFRRENLSIRYILRNREQSLIHPRLLIGLDESPTGHSLAKCSPAEPASASPAKHMMQQELWSLSTIGKQIASGFANNAITKKRLHDPQQEHKGENGSRYDDSCEHHKTKNEILCLVLYVVHVSSDR
jgi:hypothetical protein